MINLRSMDLASTIFCVRTLGRSRICTVRCKYRSAYHVVAASFALSVRLDFHVTEPRLQISTFFLKLQNLDLTYKICTHLLFWLRACLVGTRADLEAMYRKAQPPALAWRGSPCRYIIQVICRFIVLHLPILSSICMLRYKLWSSIQ